MAVVVQALVPADAAAVAFTRHPVTGRADQLVLTAVRGLGDAMVSGTVTPDTYVVDRASRGVASFEPGEDPRGAALDDAALDDLVAPVPGRRGARSVARSTSRPRSPAGRWYLLQARPITVAGPSRTPA